MIAGQWYLFAYDPMRKDMRRFVPARMEDVKVRAERFERPASFSVEKILKGSFGVYSGGSKLMTMRIRFDRFAGQRVKEKKWHHSQKIRELKEGGIEVTLELSSFVEIVPWILSWGRHARAMSPKTLVEEVAKEVRELASVYGE